VGSSRHWAGVLALRCLKEVKLEDGGREKENICNSQSINRKVKYVEEDFIMFRFMRKREGFTLIELMMVVAVIGILAAVLIPKIGGTKDSAKEAGIESNVRAVQAAVEAKIGRYQQKNASSRVDFATALKTATETLVNPVTNVSGAETIALATSTITTTAAVTINSNDAAAVAVNTDANKGAVLVTMDETNASLYSIISVTITPYDAKGNAMPATTITY